MRRILALWGALVLLATLPPALAVTVLTPEKADYAHRAAQAERAIRERRIGRYGMVPIYGRDIEDGEYPVKGLGGSVGRGAPSLFVVEIKDLGSRLGVGLSGGSFRRFLIEDSG